MPAINTNLFSLESTLIVQAHRRYIEHNEPGNIPEEAVWKAIIENHDYNFRLWKEEDLARRRDVDDSEIAANKRAIDGFNQIRNDAIEKIDEHILQGLSSVTVEPGAWQNSETAGSMIDRLSIFSLKIFHMDLRAKTLQDQPDKAQWCLEKLQQLTAQHRYLAQCFDNFLQAAQTGKAYYLIFRQHKMYNDPVLNPYLSNTEQTR